MVYTMTPLNKGGVCAGDKQEQEPHLDTGACCPKCGPTLGTHTHTSMSRAAALHHCACLPALRMWLPYRKDISLLGLTHTLYLAYCVAHESASTQQQRGGCLRNVRQRRDVQPELEVLAELSEARADAGNRASEAQHECNGRPPDELLLAHGRRLPQQPALCVKGGPWRALPHLSGM